MMHTNPYWDYVDVPTHPIKNGGWVKTVARIKHVDTGEIREHPTEEVLLSGEEHPSTYIWEDGNYACDCNRAIFFSHPDEDDEMECGEGKFQVNVLNPKDGKVFYREFDG